MLVVMCGLGFVEQEKCVCVVVQVGYYDGVVCFLCDEMVCVVCIDLECWVYFSSVWCDKFGILFGVMCLLFGFGVFDLVCELFDEVWEGC